MVALTTNRPMVARMLLMRDMAGPPFFDISEIIYMQKNAPKGRLIDLHRPLGVYNSIPVKYGGAIYVSSFSVFSAFSNFR